MEALVNHQRASDIRSGTLPCYVCTDREAIAGYCFGEAASGEVVVLALLQSFSEATPKLENE